MKHKDKGLSIDTEKVKARNEEAEREREKEKQELLKKAKRAAAENARLKVLNLKTLRGVPAAESNDRTDRVIYLNSLTGESLERELNKMPEEDIDEWSRTNESGVMASKADKTDGRIIGKIEEALQPDHTHWRRQAFWTMREACSLLGDINPDVDIKNYTRSKLLQYLWKNLNPDEVISGHKFQLFLRQYQGYQNIIEKWLNSKKNVYSKFLQTAMRGYETGDERFQSNHSVDSCDSAKYGRDICDDVTVFPHDFLGWALDNGYAVPEPFAIIPIKKPSTGKQEQSSTIDGHLREIGKKGGEQPKYNKPILEAVIQFLQRDPKIAQSSNEHVSRSFDRNVREDSCIMVKIDGYGWEVYCYAKRVYSRWDGSLAVKKPNKSEKSIAFSTLKKTYIQMAKNRLEVQEN